MQVNRPGFISWLVFDLDHANSLVWEDEGLPAPNMIVRNRRSGHAHLFYAIPPVCTTSNARSAPINYMKAVYQAMVKRLNADPAYFGPIAKTPGHPWWQTEELHSHVYELGELADHVELESAPPWATSPNLDAVEHSRVLTLFTQLRFYAYSIVNREKEDGSFESFRQRLATYADSRNRFASRGYSANIPLSQVGATVRSVARWTWDKYTGHRCCNRGVMALDNSQPLAERQRLAAQRTHKTRGEQTEARIKDAIRRLRDAGEPVSKSSVARATGLSRQNISQRYSHCFASAEQAVNYAPHKITGAPKGSYEFIPSGYKGDQNDYVPRSEGESPHAPRSGGEPMFAKLCSLLAAPSDSDALPPFSPGERARLARILMAQALPPADSYILAIAINQRSFDLALDIGGWVGYTIRASRRRKREIHDEQQALIDQFERFLGGEWIDLTDSQLEQLKEYKKGKESASGGQG